MDERKAATTTIFNPWLPSGYSIDPYEGRQARPSPNIRLAYEQCLPGGKFLYLKPATADSDTPLEQAQRKWWKEYRATTNGGREKLMRNRPAYDVD